MNLLSSRQLPPLLTSCLLLLMMGISPTMSSSQEAAAPSAEATAQHVSALDLYQQGGSMMHLLLVCSVVTIAVVAYCFLQITPKKMVPSPLVGKVNSMMAGKDVTGAYDICQDHPSSYARVISGAMLKVNFERDLANKASMGEAAVEVLDQEEHRQMVWVNYLNVIATLAPMIGLLGTVWGMIESFDKLATTSGDAKNLAGGIKMAMVTTAAGLIVGIPSMFFFFFFRDKLISVMAKVQQNASFAIDVLSGEIRLQSTTSPDSETV